MMKDYDKQQIALFIPDEMQPDRSYSGTYGHINVSVVIIDGNSCRNPDWRSAFDGLRISCQCDSQRTSFPKLSYAWQFEFADVGGTSDADRLLEKAKLLKKLQSKMQKIADEWGSPQSFGDFVIHAFHAIGAEYYALNQGGYTSSYDSMDINWTKSAETVRYRLNKMLQDWHNDRNTPCAVTDAA